MAISCGNIRTKEKGAVKHNLCLQSTLELKRERTRTFLLDLQMTRGPMVLLILFNVCGAS